VESVNWKSYGVQQNKNELPNAPMVILIHVASTNIPYTSESKEAIAGIPEIVEEVRLALQEVGRKLKAYLDKGLRVTVNADNPGISRTDFTNELHRGARMTPGGLSVWDILLLIRNGFKAAFSRRPLRQKLLRRAESEILALIREGLPS